MDSLGKITDIVLVSIVMFLIPFSWGNGEMSVLAQEKQYETVCDYISDLSKKAYISKSSYEAFTERIAGTDEIKGIEIEHRHYVENIEDGRSCGFYENFYTDEILKEVYEFGRYDFSQNDIISITLAGKNGYLTKVHTVDGLVITDNGRIVD